jgi:hypothetical protein
VRATIGVFRFVPLLACVAAAPARADFERPQPGEIVVRDRPGTGRRWQEARTLVNAPADAVRRWLTEFDQWPVRFHDVEGARVLSRTGDRSRVWLRSRIIGAELQVEITVEPTGTFYQAQEAGVSAAGRIWVTPAGDGRTDVIMQSTVHVGGVKGLFAQKGVIRERQRRKLVADLSDLHRLAAALHGAAPRATR